MNIQLTLQSGTPTWRKGADGRGANAVQDKCLFLFCLALAFRHIYCICMTVLPVCAYVYYTCGWCLWRSVPPELELQDNMSHHVGAVQKEQMLLTTEHLSKPRQILNSSCLEKSLLSLPIGQDLSPSQIPCLIIQGQSLI